MYPFVRLMKEMARHRHRPLALLDTHVSDHICWPWDLDPWMELNNGRTLSLYDLGRLPLSLRLGIVQTLRANGWSMTAAGTHVRYRRRIVAFQAFRMHSRLIGWDARFLYIEQAMWRGDEALNHILVRQAATDGRGILPPERLLRAMGQDPVSPPLPDWVTAWIAAEALRPWPPRVGGSGLGR